MGKNPPAVKICFYSLIEAQSYSLVQALITLLSHLRFEIGTVNFLLKKHSFEGTYENRCSQYGGELTSDMIHINSCIH